MSTLAIFDHNLCGGNPKSVVVSLTRGFVDRDIGMDLASLKVEGAYFSQVPPQVRIVDLGGKHLLFGLYALASYFRKEYPHFLLSARFEVNIATLLTRFLSHMMTCVVMKARNAISQEARNASKLEMRLNSHLLCWSFQWADVIVTISQQAADNLKQIGLPVDLTQVVHDPVFRLETRKDTWELRDHA
jgi:hypothetical protein